MKPKILFICKKRVDTYGNSFGLVNSANFVVGFLNSLKIDSKVVMAEDGNSIDKLVVDYNPTHVVIEALWVTALKFKELLSLHRHKKRKWIVRIHSKIPFIANEGIAFPWMLEYKKVLGHNHNFVIAPNNEEFTKDLHETIGLRTTYLPNIYCPPSYPCKEYLKDVCDNIIDVACFGAIRPMKNHLIQAVAAIKFANRIKKKLRFHVNGNRSEQHGDQVLKNLRSLFEGAKEHELVEHTWMNHERFIEVIKQMDLGLQVSLTESFNIVAADFVSSGVPIIGSPDIEWMPRLFKANPNSSDDICSALLFTYRVKDFGLHYLNNLYLNFYNHKAEKVWKQYLGADF